jgi:hypothetical protein
MRHLVIRIVFALLIFNTSAWLIRRMANVVAYFLAKGGTPDLWNLLRDHPFGTSIAIGVLAGLIPLEIWLAISGLVRAEVPELLRKLDLDQMKRWTVVLYSPVFAMTLFSWVHDWFAMRSKFQSVLQANSPMPISRMFEGFFASNCRDVYDNRLNLWTDNFAFQCTLHTMMISTLLMTAGYSMAPFLRSGFSHGTMAKNAAIEPATHEEDEPENTLTSEEQAQ